MMKIITGVHKYLHLWMKNSNIGDFAEANFEERLTQLVK